MQRKQKPVLTEDQVLERTAGLVDKLTTLYLAGTSYDDLLVVAQNTITEALRGVSFVRCETTGMLTPSRDFEEIWGQPEAEAAVDIAIEEANEVS